ncbi:MAG: DUF4143 domain-containing protein, partial [Mariprofundus sp.]|nr:DUF4143 domain-containing protein [Mariprofundus sp.]
LLDIESMEQLFSHPVYGASFEGFVLENILTQLPRWQVSFYRTSSGAEFDLILEKAGKRVAIEIKASTSPKLGRGNWSALETLEADCSYVVAPVDVTYPLQQGVMVMSLDDVIETVKKI